MEVLKNGRYFGVAVTFGGGGGGGGGGLYIRNYKKGSKIDVTVFELPPPSARRAWSAGHARRVGH